VRPDIHASVQLQDPSGNAYAAEVAFATDSYVAVTRPTDYPEGDSPHDEAFELAWPADESVHIQPVTAIERPGRETEVIWELTPVGEIRTEQRRPHPRVELRTQLTIATLDGSEHPLGTTEAMLTDLSEDAMRAAVYGREWADLEPGTSLHVGFVVDNTFFDVDGSVLRTRTSADEEDDGVEIIVMLDTDDQTIRTLREAVLAERQSS
jgi:hypothetical protein